MAETGLARVNEQAKNNEPAIGNGRWRFEIKGVQGLSSSVGLVTITAYHNDNHRLQQSSSSPLHVLSAGCTGW